MYTRRWQDWVLLILGIWLFVSPFWMAGYASTEGVSAWNSYIFGVLVVAFAWAALAAYRRWEEWVELAIGIWLVISPFVLTFYHAERGAAWNHIILGVLVVIGALWALATSPREQIRVRA